MGALIAVGGIYPGADQAVAGIRSGVQRGIRIGAIIRVYICGKVYFIVFCGLHQRLQHFIVIGSVAVFDADGHLALGAFQAAAHAAHVYGQHFFHFLGDGTAGPMANFLKNGDVLVDFPGQDNLLFLYIAGIAQQNGGTQLIVQEAALDIARTRITDSGRSEGVV